MGTRYYIHLPDAKLARGSDPGLSFTAVSAEGFAEQLQQALRSDTLFGHWLAKQEEPDEVDPALGATDPHATVTGRQDDLRVELIATNTLPGQLLQQRLRWLAGSAWELRNVTAA